jgi:hypothetical protein
MRRTAGLESARAPRPYTVSVGNAMGSRSFFKRKDAATRDESVEGDEIAGMQFSMLSSLVLISLEKVIERGSHCKTWVVCAPAVAIIFDSTGWPLLLMSPSPPPAPREVFKTLEVTDNLDPNVGKLE